MRNALQHCSPAESLLKHQRGQQMMAGPVLVIEDDLALREMMAELLEVEGFKAVTAANGREALAYLRAGGTAACILLDLMMPEMNGFEFRRQQRADPALAEIPVVVLSAIVDDRVTDLYATAAFQKPIDCEQVIDVVRELSRQYAAYHS